jgi:hypothetical protein
VLVCIFLVAMVALSDVVIFVEQQLAAGKADGVLDLRARVMTGDVGRQETMRDAVAGSIPHLAGWIQTAPLVPVDMLAHALFAISVRARNKPERARLLRNVRLLSLAECPLQNSDVPLIGQLLEEMPQCKILVLRGTFVRHVLPLMTRRIVIDVSKPAEPGVRPLFTAVESLVLGGKVKNVVWANGVDDLASTEWVSFLTTVPPLQQTLLIQRARETHLRYYTALTASGLYGVLYPAASDSTRIVKIMGAIPEDDA